MRFSNSTNKLFIFTVQALQTVCDQQQRKIEELEIALQKYQTMLQAQHQTQELAGNSNQIMNSQPEPGSSSGRIEKSDCGETIQTLELKNQMNQIQAVQQKVVADQAQLKATIQAGQSNLSIINTMQDVGDKTLASQPKLQGSNLLAQPKFLGSNPVSQPKFLSSNTLTSQPKVPGSNLPAGSLIIPIHNQSPQALPPSTAATSVHTVLVGSGSGTGSGGSNPNFCQKNQQILNNSPVIISNGIKDSSNNTGWTVKLGSNLTSEATPTLDCHSTNGTVMAAVNSWGVPKTPLLGGRTEHPIYQEPANSVNPRLNKQTSITTANNQQPASTNNIDDIFDMIQQSNGKIIYIF